MEVQYIKISKDELYHYGIKGMKWRKRKRPVRFQMNNAANRIDSAVRIEDFNHKGEYVGHTYPKKLNRSTKHEKISKTTRGLANHTIETMKPKSTMRARKNVSKILSSFGKTPVAKAQKAISKGASWFKKLSKRKS